MLRILTFIYFLISKIWLSEIFVLEYHILNLIWLVSDIILLEYICDVIKGVSYDFQTESSVLRVFLSFSELLFVRVLITKNC